MNAISDGRVGMTVALVLLCASNGLAAVCSVPSGPYLTVQSAVDDPSCTEIVLAAQIFEGSGSGLDADTLDGIDSTSIARISHLHDGRFYTQTELNSSGAGGAVHWNNLTGVPAGFADGVDDDTTYSFGPGLTVSEGQIVIDPAAFTLQVTTLDSAGDVGDYSSLAIGTDGFALISYHDITNGDLKVALLPIGL